MENADPGCGLRSPESRKKAPSPLVLAASVHSETISLMLLLIDLSGECDSIVDHHIKSFCASLETLRRRFRPLSGK